MSQCSATEHVSLSACFVEIPPSMIGISAVVLVGGEDGRKLGITAQSTMMVTSG